jgi:hypothetical protein
LEKLLKNEGHMPEDKYLVMSRKGKRLGVGYASTPRGEGGSGVAEVQNQIVRQSLADVRLAPTGGAKADMRPLRALPEGDCQVGHHTSLVSNSTSPVNQSASKR